MDAVNGEPPRPSQRPAAAGELCTCGREALVVYLDEPFGAVGHCGFDDGGLPASGVCTFCRDSVDHDHYRDTERAAGRDPRGGTGTGAQSAPCPLYRLRLTDPPPSLHPESVRAFDPDAHRLERAQARLVNEVFEVLIAAGADPDATYTLPTAGPGWPGRRGDLEDVTFDLVSVVRRALDLDPHDPARGGRHPDAGRDAVEVLVTLLRARLDDIGADPNPLTGSTADDLNPLAELDAAALTARVGGPEAWAQTVAHDRPLLVARRVARRALDPEVPDDIYRTWST